MRRTVRYVLLLAVWACGWPAVAEAQGSAGGLFGFGTDFESDDINRFGFNLGARGGHTFGSGLYAGGIGLFHIGEEDDIGDTKASYRQLHIGGEIGYDIGIKSIIVRPYAGLGLSFSFVEVGDVDDRETDFFMEFGGLVLYPIGRFFVGGDLRFEPVFADDTFTGIVFSLTAGYAWGENPYPTGAEVAVKDTEQGTTIDVQTE